MNAYRVNRSPRIELVWTDNGWQARCEAAQLSGFGPTMAAACDQLERKLKDGGYVVPVIAPSPIKIVKAKPRKRVELVVKVGEGTK